MQQSPLKKKRLTKQDKETAILFGLIEMYIKTYEPIGSNSLKEKEFEYMSSATIRNYFAKLEKKGLLTQQHASGGRLPTAKAFQLYAEKHLQEPLLDKKDDEFLKNNLKIETEEVVDYLTHAAEILSQITKCAVFQSSPRFDQDFIRDIKLINLNNKKILFVVITDFGLIKTETLVSQKEINDKDILQIEECFAWMLHKKEKPQIENQALVKLAQYFFNEIMVRYVADYSSFSNEEIYRCGLSNLLNYPEFNDLTLLANSLELFEDKAKMQIILKNCYDKNNLVFFLGPELKRINSFSEESSVIAIPYYINQSVVGATAILGPIRLCYRKIFPIMLTFSRYMSETLTKNVYKHQITFRQPTEASFLSSYKRSVLLEDQRKTKSKE